MSSFNIKNEGLKFKSPVTTTIASLEKVDGVQNFKLDIYPDLTLVAPKSAKSLSLGQTVNITPKGTKSDGTYVVSFEGEPAKKAPTTIKAPKGASPALGRRYSNDFR